ncbi:hypothetical protein PanWU01x14_210850 [Parasponia andersonii]|uniref:Uncharacterized protein n=1 Tax=Parasponia andersonii TaxID=3476 RepID=A0A2P5BTY6_PARAD|nr:hypothetical protein PanWU01x14_210850 [Parasponia andersonii]
MVAEEEEESTDSKIGSAEKAKGAQKKKNKAKGKHNVVAKEEIVILKMGTTRKPKRLRRRRTGVTGNRKRWRRRTMRRVPILKMGTRRKLRTRPSLLNTSLSLSMSASQGHNSLTIFDFNIKTLGNFYGFYI